MTRDQDSINDLENGCSEGPADLNGGGEADSDQTATLLDHIAAAVDEIAGSADRYHDRAQQREGVIDYLRSELDLLRRGERRGLLRPLLADMCRMRNDLLRQADTLPSDFDAERARKLLGSYADDLELTLDSNGVTTYAPDSGDAFNPRMHRRVQGTVAASPDQAGLIADVRRDGYLDIAANSPIAPAEVVVYTAPAADEPAPDSEGEQ